MLLFETMRAIYFLVLLCVSNAYADQNRCFDDAARRIGVDSDLLRAISKVESGMKPHELHLNNNGTVDIGNMQVNSKHLPLLKRAGFGAKDLLEPCTSIEIGAVLFKECIRIHGNTWRAVGAYNTGPYNSVHGKSKDVLRRIYVAKVSKEYYRLKLLKGV